MATDTGPATEGLAPWAPTVDTRAMRLHHVQVAIPPGGEDRARGFYADLLGMREIAKPPTLADRGGCWFRLGSAELHCGIEDGFAPARKAHPALEVEDLDWLQDRLRRAGYVTAPDTLFPGRDRFYVDDPFGNRVEILGPSAAGTTA